MIKFVRDGDTVLLHSMDRLARSLDDLRRWAMWRASCTSRVMLSSVVQF